MAWNQPSNNGRDNDPWGSGNKRTPEQKNDNNQRPTHGNDIFQKINLLLGQLLNNKGKKGYSPNKTSGKSGISSLFSLLAVIIGAIWVFSGFYTIEEGHEGVIMRFGKAQPTVIMPGLHWKPSLIDKILIVDSQGNRDFKTSGVMLTSDENIVNVEMSVVYQVDDPIAFLFSVTDAQGSLKQAADSALRSTIGKYPMEKTQTDGKVQISNDTQKDLNEIIANYRMGIKVIAVNLESVRPPEAVKAAFDDAISAQEDEQNLILQSQSYTNRVVPEAEGNAAELIAKAKAYKEKVIKEAEGEVAQFLKLLPEYKAAPDVTRSRLYISTMEKVMSQTAKVFIDSQSGNNVIVLPLDKSNENNSALNRLVTEKAEQLAVVDQIINKPSQKAAEPPVVMRTNRSGYTSDQTVIRHGR